MAWNKTKILSGLAAGVTAAALLIGGTFAWVSFSQTALNESTGVVNVGGRLHDDFDGTNKDVYVENFTDPYNGGQPIYARIMLTEYMEVGQDAGGTDVNNDGTIAAVPVVDGTDIDNTDTWTPHVPQTDCAVCETEGTCRIHSHWVWEMGGQTTYMPTFNKDKDSLAADINGTYAGTNLDDKVYYDDYVVYTTEEGGLAVDMDDPTFTAPAGATLATPLTEAAGSVNSVIGTEYYDDDTDTEENTDATTRQVAGVTHTAKQTATATVITMAEWIAAGSQPGNFWVYDTDGWAYWANPIMPGEATGLLLSNIEMTKNPGEKCYYAINVVGQFATVGDWTQFGVDEEDEDYPSADALTLLETASQNVPVVTVTNLDGKTLVSRGESVSFSATTAVGAASAAADDEYDWVVLNEAREVITEGTVITNNGDGTATLTVGADETSAGLYVAASSKTHGGAVGMSSVAVQHYTVTVSTQDDITVVEAGDSLQLIAEVVDAGTGEDDTSGVTWELTGHTQTGTFISEDGVLTIDADEQGGTVLTVIAISKADDTFRSTCTVTVADKYSVTISAQDDAAYVDPGETLPFNVTVIKNGAEDDTSGVTWEITGGNGTSAMDANDRLVVGPTETGGTTLTLKATSEKDDRASDTWSVTVNDYAVTVTADGNATGGTAGAQLAFTAEVTKNGSTDTSGVKWSVSGGNGTSSINEETGLLTVGGNETAAAALTVKATSEKDDRVSGTCTVTVNQYEVTVTASLQLNDKNETKIASPTAAYADDVLNFTAKVTKNGSTDNSGVTWSVSGGSVTISDSGVLTVPAALAHNTPLTITATSKAANTASDTYPITIYDGYERLQEITPGTLETVKIDDMRWFVLKKDDQSTKALIWAAQVIPGRSESYFYSGSTSAGRWDTSVTRSYLNGDFLTSRAVLNANALETTFYTADNYNRSSTTYTSTTDKIFLPSEADIFGTAGDYETSEVKEYTLGEVGIIINEGMRPAIDKEDSWLRSPGDSSSNMPQLQGRYGTLYFFQWSTKLRPALWIDISN